jgi:hypothetical protein
VEDAPMKKALLLTLVLAGVMVGGLFAFSSWKTIPEYSLLKIKEALEANDPYLFKKHVDIEMAAERMIDVVLEELQDSLTETQDEDAAFDITPLFFGMLEMVKPMMVSVIVDQVEKYVEDGVIPTGIEPVDSDENSLGILPIDTDYFLEYGGMFLRNTRKFLEKEDRIATLGLEFIDDEGNPRLIEVLMRKYEDYWRVTEISNFKEIWAWVGN